MARGVAGAGRAPAWGRDSRSASTWAAGPPEVSVAGDISVTATLDPPSATGSPPRSEGTTTAPTKTRPAAPARTGRSAPRRRRCPRSVSRSTTAVGAATRGVSWASRDSSWAQTSGGMGAGVSLPSQAATSGSRGGNSPSKKSGSRLSVMAYLPGTSGHPRRAGRLESSVWWASSIRYPGVRRPLGPPGSADAGAVPRVWRVPGSIDF